MMLILVLICSLLRFECIDAHVGVGCLKETNQGVRILCSSFDHLISMPDEEAAKIVVLHVECTKRTSNSGLTMQAVDFRRFISLRTLSVVNCSLTEVGDFIFEGNDMLESIDLSNNSLTILRWQSMAHARSLSSITLNNNHLSCDCRNEWLKTDGVGSESWHQREIFHLPIKIRTDTMFENGCKFNNCPHSILEPLNAIVNAQIDASFELICNLRGADELNASKYDAFEWIYASLSHIHTSSIRITNKSMSIRVENATSNEMGIVICKCWSCRMPIFGSIQVRIPTNLSARIVESHLPELIIHGYPLDELTIEVHSISSQINDSSPLLERTSLLNDSISLRLELEHSQFFVRYYSLYYTPCANCFQYSGIFIFNICSLQSCTSIQYQLHSSHHQIFQGYFAGKDISRSNNYKWALIIVVLVLLFALISSLGAFLYVKQLLRSENWKRRRISRNTEETSMPLEETSLFSSDYGLVPIIDRDAIKLHQKIGHGAFGEVFSADWSGSPTGRVAIKVLHHVEIDAEMSKEAHLLSQLEHPNIVRLFGVAKDRHQILLVLELISLGDLKSYVRARIPLCTSYSQFPPALTNDELLNICIQICHGLCYLNSQQIVHRDLAARNCLVSGESDLKICNATQRPPFTVKISDFGMSRRLYSQAEYYRMNSSKTILPVRWLAPECIQYCKFTHASDMWAYGVTIWEVYTYGEVPFGELSNGEVLSALLNGIRLSKPNNAPADLLQIMDDCWEVDAEKRPLSIDILTRLTLCQ